MVIGGGIVGLTTALLIRRGGADVVLLEARRLGRGVSGNTTAKLSSLHGLRYAQLKTKLGSERARAYGELSEAGLARVRGLVEELSIGCDLRSRLNFTYAESPEELRRVEAEVEVAAELGLPASFAEKIDLPFPVMGAVQFADQAEFHPYKYLTGLAATAASEGVRIREKTRATAVNEGNPCLVQFEGGEVSAGHVVVATHIPFLDRGLYFARTSPSRSYAIAVRASEEPQQMYLSTENQAHSIRSAPGPDGELLIVGGEAHKTGQSDEAQRFLALEAFAKDRLGATSVAYRWASQDPISADHLPLIGTLRPGSRRLFTATGFSKWGLAAGTEAAGLLCDAVLGKHNRFGETFDPHRGRARGILVSMPQMLREGLDFGKRMVWDRVRGRTDDQPPPGSGAVLRRGAREIAVYTDPSGEPHELSARCTHLGCIVKWNDADKSWDCPCHGSRFAATGEVLEGPAVHGLRSPHSRANRD